jgi:endonuclease G
VAIDPDEAVYRDNDLDRGHLVRRLDPAWGASDAEARAANDDTFHFTNASPQHREFNAGQTLWAGLEDYLLSQAALLDDLATEEAFSYGAYRTFQVTVRRIAELTGLGLAPYIAAGPLERMEATPLPRELIGPEDLLL